MATILTMRHCLNARLASALASRSSLLPVVTATSITRAKPPHFIAPKPFAPQRALRVTNILREKRKPIDKDTSAPSSGQTPPSTAPEPSTADATASLKQALEETELLFKLDQLSQRRTRRCTIITWSFIAVCVFITLSWQSIFTAARDQRRLEADPELYKKLEISYQILSHVFTLKEDKPNPFLGLGASVSHREYMHLGVNMLAFHTFTSIFKHFRIAGCGIATRHLMGIMLASALLCNAAQKLEWTMRPSEGRPRSALGASGVVSGLGMAMALLTPETEVMLMLVPVPLALAVLGLAAYDLFYLGRQKDSVSHSGHLGGFVGGALYYALFMRNFKTLTAVKLVK